jgi:hypothetical protein
VKVRQWSDDSGWWYACDGCGVAWRVGVGDLVGVELQAEESFTNREEL